MRQSVSGCGEVFDAAFIRCNRPHTRRQSALILEELLFSPREKNNL